MYISQKGKTEAISHHWVIGLDLTKAPIPNFPQLPSMLCSGCPPPTKKNPKRSQSHVYMGLPSTISSPFPEMGARQLVGGVGRKGFAACDCLGLVCSSSSHRDHFYAFKLLLSYCQLPPNYPSCHHVPWFLH